MDTSEWQVRPSETALRTRNYIREIVDGLRLEPNPDKPLIALSIGDPCVYGNLGPPPHAVAALSAAAQSGRHHGYANSAGTLEARQAVLEYLSYPSAASVTAEDVLLCSGCSGAIELCVAALSGPGKVLLVPRPGFPLYKTLADSAGASTRCYDLLAEQDWQPDLVQLAQLCEELGDRAVGLVVCNPSNPCGSVYGGAVLASLAALAGRFRLPIIADEVYERLSFSGDFQPMAGLGGEAPVLVCGGTAKRFLVPGWRLGWVVVCDPAGRLSADFRRCLNSLTQRTIGANTLVQAALPDLLLRTPPDFHAGVRDLLRRNAQLLHARLVDVDGLQPYMPQGAMYMMVRVDVARFRGFASVSDWVQRLMEDQSVFCLPGECFETADFMRLVLTPPTELLEEACDRIQEFCQKHRAQ